MGHGNAFPYDARSDLYFGLRLQAAKRTVEVDVTPHDSVRKAAAEIRIHWATQAQIGITELLPQKSFDEDTASIIDRHCHVTEMEAVIEKAREALKLAQLEGRHFFKGSWVDKSMSEALSSIDALKGGGE